MQSSNISFYNSYISHTKKQYLSIWIIYFYVSYINTHTNTHTTNILLDGKCLACTFRAKFIEVSVGINHNVDELLAGILQQIRLKKEQNAIQV